MFRVHTETLALNTKKEMQVVDITGEVVERLEASGVQDGTVTVFVPGATGGITTVEYEPGLVQDLETAFEKVAPRHGAYGHDARWGDGNGHAHIRASLLGPSLTVPVADRRLVLGTWQQIIFVDFDPPARSRKIVLQFMGEGEAML
ncbi:MAG: secondary thiamine-phosphate synthase enzyme YjbQ [Planctomycetota bacterium]|jgi:secondary thiamine-phosphate synthase enzyme